MSKINLKDWTLVMTYDGGIKKVNAYIAKRNKLYNDYEHYAEKQNVNQGRYHYHIYAKPLKSTL